MPYPLFLSWLFPPEQSYPGKSRVSLPQSTRVNLLGLLKQNTTDWVAYKQTSIALGSEVLEAGQSKVQAAVDLVSGDR